MAIANAIYNATGVRLYELPLSPDKVLKGLKTLERGAWSLPPPRYLLGSDMYERLDYLREHPVVTAEVKN